MTRRGSPAPTVDNELEAAAVCVCVCVCVGRLLVVYRHARVCFASRQHDFPLINRAYDQRQRNPFRAKSVRLFFTRLRARRRRRRRRRRQRRRRRLRDDEQGVDMASRCRRRRRPVRLVSSLLLRIGLWCVVFAARLQLSASTGNVDGGGGTAAAPGSVDAYQSLSQIKGLYDSSDSVLVLNSSNFKSTVYGSERAWLVEFYNSWCGYCRRFAPTWKSLAIDVRGWRDTVAIAALDCADEDNNPLCREYEIMRYPEVRYFGPEERLGTLGTEVEKGKDAEELRANLARRLRKEQLEGRGDKWPNITPFRSSEVKNIWDGVPDAVRYFFFIFEETDSYLGAQIILDLRNATSLVLRSVSSDNSPLCLMHEIKRFPSLVVYARDGTQKRLAALRVPTRAATRNAIVEFMRSRGIEVTVDKPEEAAAAAATSAAAAAADASRRVTPNDAIRESGDFLHRADLEATLRFSFGHEIPMTKMIEGRRMSTLKNFTSVLASYFPTKSSGGGGRDSMFLEAIALVVGSKNATSGQDFATLVSSSEREMSPVYSELDQWIGCKSSKPGLRGYPCGLWNLFHALTVDFAAKSFDRTNEDPTRVLRAIHAYVEYFFGCADCARHFVAMAEKNRMTEVDSADESVLWLWRAHNEVNERLAADETQDPIYPKIPYPSRINCPSCSDSDARWNTSEVLAYLKKKYSRSAVRYSGATKSSPPPSLRRNDRTTKEPRGERVLTLYEQRVNGKKFGWDFTIFDISICVVLYVTSATILILVCIKFAVKRSSHKKRVYVHSILGKV